MECRATGIQRCLVFDLGQNKDLNLDLKIVDYPLSSSPWGFGFEVHEDLITATTLGSVVASHVLQEARMPPSPFELFVKQNPLKQSQSTQ